MTGKGQISNSDTLTADLLFTVPMEGAVYRVVTTSMAQLALVNHATTGARDSNYTISHLINSRLVTTEQNTLQPNI
jgi:hypothetical protein